MGETIGLQGIPYRRLLFEHIIPKLALLLGLEKESSYEEVVIAILELIAFDNNVERFKFYSIHEFSNEIRKNLKGNRLLKAEENPRLPIFVRQSDVLSRAVKDRIVREIVTELFGEYLLTHLAH